MGVEVPQGRDDQLVLVIDDEPSRALDAVDLLAALGALHRHNRNAGRKALRYRAECFDGGRQQLSVNGPVPLLGDGRGRFDERVELVPVEL